MENPTEGVSAALVVIKESFVIDPGGASDVSSQSGDLDVEEELMRHLTRIISLINLC